MNALLLLDFQRGLCHGPVGQASGLAAEVERRGVLARAANALEFARRSGYFIAHVGVGFDPGYTNRTNRGARFASFEARGLFQHGDPDTEFCEEVTPAPGEPVIVKGCVSPFSGTPLMGQLVTRGVTHLYLCGVATNFVVESAARHAGDAGYAVTVLEDACASYNQAMHDFAVERTLPLFAEVSTTEALE